MTADKDHEAMEALEHYDIELVHIPISDGTKEWQARFLLPHATDWLKTPTAAILAAKEEIEKQKENSQ